MAADRIEKYTNDDVVRFKHEISSISPNGSGWNPDTNKFRCPYDGYYRFVATLYKSEGSSTNHHANLMVSSTSIVSVLNYRASGVRGYVHYSSTMSAIVPCHAGQEVWVRILPYAATTARLYSSGSDHHLQHFSGQLIKQGLE